MKINWVTQGFGMIVIMGAEPLSEDDVRLSEPVIHGIQAV
jgi:hypothetical protein